MRISVDQSRCQGHALCLTIAPELFDFDDDSGHALANQGASSSQSELAKRAVESCPEQAITVAL